MHMNQLHISLILVYCCVSVHMSPLCRTVVLVRDDVDACVKAPSRLRFNSLADWLPIVSRHNLPVLIRQTSLVLWHLFPVLCAGT